MILSPEKIIERATDNNCTFKYVRTNKQLTFCTLIPGHSDVLLDRSEQVISAGFACCYNFSDWKEINIDSSMSSMHLNIGPTPSDVDNFKICFPEFKITYKLTTDSTRI